MTKPIIRQSSFQNYPICPKMFKLSQKHEIKQSKAMIAGKIFEACLFEYQDREDIKPLCLTVAGKPNADSKRLEPLAEKCRQYLPSKVHHTRLNLDMGDFILSGEPDYCGTLINPVIGDLYEDVNVDIKLTGDICKIWDWKATKSDYFQAVSYTYLTYKLTGIKKRFFYFIVQDCDFEKPLIRIVEVIVKDSDLIWFEKLCFTAAGDIFCDPNLSKCKGTGKFDPPCRYLEFCTDGLDVIGGFETIVFDSLSSEFQPELKPIEEFKVSNKKPRTFTDLPETEELTETDFNEIEQVNFKSITVCQDDLRDNGYRCRNCRTVSIQAGDKECSNCHAKLIWM